MTGLATHRPECDPGDAEVRGTCHYTAADRESLYALTAIPTETLRVRPGSSWSREPRWSRTPCTGKGSRGTPEEDLAGDPDGVAWLANAAEEHRMTGHEAMRVTWALAVAADARDEADHTRVRLAD